jgi:hypothetical protein
VPVVDWGRVGKKFKIGDQVTWNSEAGFVSGTIVKIHKKDFDYKGYTHYASKEDPQYEIKSDKTDHIAVHKGRPLSKKDGLKFLHENHSHICVNT